YPGAASAGVSAVLLAVVLYALVAAPAPRRRHLLGFALLALVSYGAVAVGRGTLLSLTLGVAKGATVGHYHYVATIALTALLCLALAEVARGLGVSPRLAATAFAAWAALAIAGLLGLRTPIDHHFDDRFTTELTLQQIRTAVGAGAPGAVVVIPNRA